MFLSTGIEYGPILKYVRKMAEEDPRIKIVNSGVNIKQMLSERGYPFKSKEHSEKLHTYQLSGMCKTVTDYLGMGEKKTFLCPKMLHYQFSPEFKLKVSKRCCDVLKKNVSNRWARANGKTITITGIRNEEGGIRKSVHNCVSFRGGEITKFHPLLVVNEEWENWFIESRRITLCELYYPPFNFERTGCAGCPYNVDLQEELDLLEKFLPAEKKKCEYIWKEVYDEYRRLGYRLK